MNGVQEEEVHDRLYNDTKSRSKSKKMLENHYNNIYMPFHPMINHAKSPANPHELADTSSLPAAARKFDRSNSDEILKTLLTDLLPGNADHPAIQANANNNKGASTTRIQEMKVPKHQKEHIKDMLNVHSIEPANKPLQHL